MIRTLFTLMASRKTKGQGMVEYALLVALIAIVVMAVLVLLGPAIAAKFQQVITELNK